MKRKFNISVNDLAKLMREASKAHHEYEMNIGRSDNDWPTWYAIYMLGHDEMQASQDHPMVRRVVARSLGLPHVG